MSGNDDGFLIALAINGLSIVLGFATLSICLALKGLSDRVSELRAGEPKEQGQ